MSFVWWSKCRSPFVNCCVRARSFNLFFNSSSSSSSLVNYHNTVPIENQNSFSCPIESPSSIPSLANSNEVIIKMILRWIFKFIYISPFWDAVRFSGFWRVLFFLLPFRQTRSTVFVIGWLIENTLIWLTVFLIWVHEIMNQRLNWNCFGYFCKHNRSEAHYFRINISFLN